MLRTTWHNSIRTPIPTDVRREDLIATLHDHSFLITINPLVYRHEETGRTGDRVQYDVWDKVDMLPFGLWKHDVQFTVAFEDTSDGVVTDVQAPMNLTSHVRYTVQRDQSQGGSAGGEGTNAGGAGWMLVEELENSCSVFLKTFIDSTMVAVHKKIHVSVIDRARRQNGGR